MTDLKLDELWVVYPGDREYPLGERIRVRPLDRHLVSTPLAHGRLAEATSDQKNDDRSRRVA